MAIDALSHNSQVVVLLCSRLMAGSSESIRSLTVREWSMLKERLDEKHIEPSGLLEFRDQTELERELKIETEIAYRIMELLKLGGNLALELENLSQQGIWVLTEYEDSYPERLADKLDDRKPPVIFGAGDISRLNDGGLAIVGSRDVDSQGQEFTKRIGVMCAQLGITVLSGAARGVDQTAMVAAVENGGQSVGVLADSLQRFIKAKNTRELIVDGRLTVITVLHPGAGFSIAGAMARNKYIYSLADHAMVVSSAKGSGGTWSGAVEAINKNLCPVIVRDGETVPDGNTALIKKGAIPINNDFDSGLTEFLESASRKASASKIPKPEQMTLNLDN